MRCLPLNGFKRVGYGEYQWEDIRSGENHSFNDQPAWVHWSFRDKEILEIIWENKGFYYRGYNKPCHLRYLYDHGDFAIGSYKIIENIHPDYSGMKYYNDQLSSG